MDIPVDFLVPEASIHAEDQNQQHQDNLDVPEQNANNKTDDEINLYTCFICRGIMEDVKVTKCGHTFCHNCILRTIQIFGKCPDCGTYLTENDLAPNYLFAMSLAKYRERNQISEPSNRENFENLFTDSPASNDVHEINQLILLLTQRKAMLEVEEASDATKLLIEFLQKLEMSKTEQLKKLNSRRKIIKDDLSFVEEMLKALTDDDSSNVEVEDFTPSELQREIMANFDSIADCYFEIRVNEAYRDSNFELSDFGLNTFCEDFAKFFRYKSMKLVAPIDYSHISPNSSGIVSSIDFHKSNDYFAVAGIMRNIMIYNYNSITQNPLKIPQHDLELISTSKVSCISWNQFRNNYLCSSDYEGTVLVWDAMTKMKLQAFSEHKKRCWSVNFNAVDYKLIASGSDDTTAKLWSIDMNRSVATFQTNARVCCVQFNPHSSCHLAFGTSDHLVHYYDIRNPRIPLRVFEGHKKAVSYVKFLSHQEMVSASTDSELKVWNDHKIPCLRSLTGHVNNKSFVGLATDGDYIACGSENDSLYFYYKKMKTPVFAYNFATGQSNRVDKFEEMRNENQDHFVSAVCWRPGSTIWIAANSQTQMRILELA